MKKTLSSRYVDNSFRLCEERIRSLIASRDYIRAMINHIRARRMLRFYARDDIYSQTKLSASLLNKLHNGLDTLCDEIDKEGRRQDK
jgi:hypothetical protein